MDRKPQSVGKIGEQIAKRFLAGKGMDIIESNYRANHGEIDIIATDSHVYVFVEVKTISKKIQSSDVTRETYRPEYNIDEHKIHLVRRTGELYLSKQNVKSTWRIDVIAVELDQTSKIATVRHIKNVWL